MVVIVRCFKVGGCVHCAKGFKMLTYFMDSTTAVIFKVSSQSDVDLAMKLF